MFNIMFYLAFCPNPCPRLIIATAQSFLSLKLLAFFCQKSGSMAIITGTTDVDYVSRANDPATSALRFARNAAEATWPFVKIEDTMREGTEHLRVDITLGALASPNPDAEK